MKVAFDANVLFAAIYNPSGRPARLVNYCHQRGYHLGCCDYAWAELEKNIRKKCAAKIDRLSELRRLVAVLSTPCLDHDDFAIRAKDLPILRSALYHQCDYLVTGDKRDFSHLMALGRQFPLQVVTVAALWDTLSPSDLS